MPAKRNYAEPDESEYRSRASSWTASQKKAYDNQSEFIDMNEYGTEYLKWLVFFRAWI